MIPKTAADPARPTAVDTQPCDVELRGVTKTYGSTVAVAGIDLTIGRGQLVSLLGPSGSGKTTVLRMIAGLVDPTAGEIYIRGREVSRVPVHRRGLAMMFQNYSLFPHMTVAQNAAFGLEMRDVPRGEVSTRVTEVLELVQLKGLGGRYPRQLSGGQQQRVALARCLAISPAVLLLDEPLAALDKKLREAMQVELRALQRRLRITTIFVTHDQEEALTLSDRIAILNEGRVEQVGTPFEIYERPASRFVSQFIGVSNFLEAVLEGPAEGGLLVLRTPGGLRLGVRESAVAGSRDGRLTVAVRPEKITLSRSGADGGPNVATGSVVNVVYLGNLTQWDVRLDTGEQLTVVRQNQEAELPWASFGPGDQVGLRWVPEANRVLLT